MARVFDTPIITNDQSIDRVIAAGLPVLLVFFNGAPQVMLTETINRLARENAGQVLIAQVQVKDNPETVRRYQVSQTPAVVDLRNGQVQAQGPVSTASDLEKHLAYLLGRGPKPEAQQQASSFNGTTRASGNASGHPMVVTDATFEKDVMASAQPVLVDFWAPWCGPCRMVEPTVEKLAHELVGKARIAKVNVDENPGIAMRYGIQSIPTMMVVKNGKIVDRWAGALPEPALRSRVTPLLSS